MSRVDLRKQSLKHVYATLRPPSGGLPINEHMSRCLKELERWLDVKLYIGNGPWEFECIGYGEKLPADRWLDDEEDDDDDEDDFELEPPP